MQALVFRNSLPRLAFATFFGTSSPRAYLGLGSPIQYEEVPEPTLVGDDWTIVRTALCGVCGSAVKQVFLHGNFDISLTSLISFPQILGHEVVGVVDYVGPSVKT
jgi:threonine dehydrogenase-like Zn-dependent dehydrogenase